MQGCIRFAFLFFIAYVIAHSAKAADTELENDLPRDAPLTPVVIHYLKQPLSDTTHFELGYSYLYGDKFLSTQGFTLRGNKYLSETFAIGGALSFYSSNPNSDYQELQNAGTPPVAHDPSFMIRANVLYQPVYGKLAFGSKIVRFRLGLEAGLHIAQESLRIIGDRPSSTQGKSLFGPGVGVRLFVPVFNDFSLISRAEYLLHGGLDGEVRGRKLFEVSLGVGYQL